jgi:HAD superfamily hydrolase (TIGR01509 family)
MMEPRTTERSRFDLVIFDCDGVLVDSERITVEVEARLLSELGWIITVDEVVRRFLGVTSAHMMAEVEHHLGPHRTREFARRSHHEIGTAFETRLQAVDGVGLVIEQLERAGVLTCVASSGSHDKIRTTLGITGLWATFAGRIFSADDVARGKPWPDLFLHAAMRMGVEPQRCAVIEDSVHGVRAAVSAGMTCFAYCGGLTNRDALESAGAATFAEMSGLTQSLISETQ